MCSVFTSIQMAVAIALKTLNHCNFMEMKKTLPCDSGHYFCDTQRSSDVDTPTQTRSPLRNKSKNGFTCS